MRRSDLLQHSEKHHTGRTTQIVFGERQHLLRVLDSIENRMSRARALSRSAARWNN